MMAMRTRRGIGVGGFLLLAILLSAARQVYAAPSNVAAWRYEDFSGTGSTVGTAGDFNCDGIADLLLGNEYGSVSNFQPNEGWVGIWFGGATLPPQPSDPPDWRVRGSGVPFSSWENAKLGATSAAGDVNRDGCDDVIVSSRLSFGVGPNIRAYFGAPGGPATNPGWLRFLLESGAEVESIATGDVNGDGTADIIAGIPLASFGQNKEGAVLVWLGSQFLSGSSLTLGYDWIAQSDQDEAELGRSVASGDVNGDGRDDVVAGAPRWDTSGGLPYTDTGRAFMWPGAPLFESTADGTPANAVWSHVIGGNNSQLGFSVAVPGDVDGDGFADIVFGAPTFDNTNLPGTAEGTVLVTRGASSQPTTDFASWFHFGTADGGQLGFAVASAGDVNGDGRADYLMGEPGIGTSGGRGRAHLLLGRATASWTINPATDVHFSEAGTASPNPNPISLNYGARLGTAGDWNDDGYSDIVVSVQYESESSPASSGKAFVYLGRGETLASAPAYTSLTGQVDSNLGLGLAFAGDINHDGFSDVVSGAPNYESSAAQNGEGRIFVDYGGTCGPACNPFPPELIFPSDREGNQVGANLGWSVSGAGDVNGDGFADVVAGAPLFDSQVFCGPPLFLCPVSDTGMVRVYLGGSGGLSVSASLTLTGDQQQSAQFGYTVANAGDVNGDGFGDVIVGAPFGNSGLANEGRVFLYLGTASGLSSTPSWSKSGGQTNARFGIDVAAAGDVDGDGFSDVIIGADGYGATGAAFIYRGRPTNASFPQGLSDTPIRTLVGVQAGSSFGLTVASAGDLNRDGLSDIAVGAPKFFFSNQTGAVTVYHGKSPGPDTTPNTTLLGEIIIGFPPAENRFGNGVAGAGDVNGDGFGDLIVGDQWITGTAGFAQGKAYIFHGGPTGITASSALAAQRTFQDCPTSSCDFGRDVAGGGDVNGDGFSDVLIGGFGFEQSSANEGAVFVHLGNEGRGTPLQLLQSFTFGGVPSAILGATPNWFDASMNLKSPAGRTRVQLEFEVKPFGQNFDGLNTLKVFFLDNVLNPIDIRTYLAGNPGDTFQWRARLRSASPLFGRSRWISLPENAPREMDVRVLPEPGLAAALLAGIGLLAGLDCRRRSQLRVGDRGR